jgi:hypothetical protein
MNQVAGKEEVISTMKKVNASTWRGRDGNKGVFQEGRRPTMAHRSRAPPIDQSSGKRGGGAKKVTTKRDLECEIINHPLSQLPHC